MKREVMRESRGFPWMTWAVIGFVAVTAYLLLAEHPAHFASFLPFILLLACPLMHLFHHGRHEHKDMTPDATRTDGMNDGSDGTRRNHWHG